MVNKYIQNASCQTVITDGDLRTSNIIISGRLRIDWNAYKAKKGLLECLAVGVRDKSCNVPDVSLINLFGDTGRTV